MFCKLSQALRTPGRTTRRFFSKKSYYDILGVPRGATQAEIKKAYAKLAREYHPDKNTAADAKQKFSEINDAYQTLADDKKRQVYDQTGMTGDEQKQYQNSGFDPNGQGFDFSDFFRGGQAGGQEGANPFGNMFRDFEDIFGMGRDGGRANVRGADVVLNLEIDFMDAVNGLQKEVSFRVKDNCATCKGNKCKPGTSPTKCNTCAGKGTMNYRQGPMVLQMECNACGGMGTTIKNPCATCRGSGVGHTTKTENIQIPKGINTGQNLRVSGKGNKGEHGGVSGDLLIKIAIKPHPYFRRQDYDVFVDQPLSISQAVLGCKLDVQTLTGKKSITVPPGTMHGNKLKIPGEGVTKLAPNNHTKGDMFVVFSVSIPNSLTPEQRAIFEQLKNLETKKSGGQTAQTSDASGPSGSTGSSDAKGTQSDHAQSAGAPSGSGEGQGAGKDGFFKHFENLFHKSN